jgi:hypothetical protein
MSSNNNASRDVVAMPHFHAAKTRAMDRLLDEATDAVKEYIIKKKNDLKKKTQSIDNNNNKFVMPPLLTVKSTSAGKSKFLPPVKESMSSNQIGASINQMDWKMKLLNNRIDNVKKRNNVIMKSWKKQLQRADKAEIELSMIKNELKNVKETLQMYIDKEDLNFKETLKSNLTCAICLDLLYQPISLPKCAHKFCKLCWVKCALHAAEGGQITQCPQCRIVEEGVDFPIDNTLFNTIELLFPNECYLRKKNWDGI